MAITQIHTHQRNRHGSCRDGEGGTLDASQPHSDQSCAQRRRRSEEELRKHPGAFQLSTHRRCRQPRHRQHLRGSQRLSFSLRQTIAPHRLSRRAALAPCNPTQHRQHKPSIATTTPQPESQQSIARQAQRGPRISACRAHAERALARQRLRHAPREGASRKVRAGSGPAQAGCRHDAPPREGGKARASWPG